jgi:hypothetical protein
MFSPDSSATAATSRVDRWADLIRPIIGLPVGRKIQVSDDAGQVHECILRAPVTADATELVLEDSAREVTTFASDDPDLIHIASLAPLAPPIGLAHRFGRSSSATPAVPAKSAWQLMVDSALGKAPGRYTMMRGSASEFVYLQQAPSGYNGNIILIDGKLHLQDIKSDSDPALFGVLSRIIPATHEHYALGGTYLSYGWIRGQYHLHLQIDYAIPLLAAWQRPFAVGFRSETAPSGAPFSQKGSRFPQNLLPQSETQVSCPEVRCNPLPAGIWHMVAEASHSFGSVYGPNKFGVISTQCKPCICQKIYSAPSTRVGLMIMSHRRAIERETWSKSVNYHVTGESTLETGYKKAKLGLPAVPRAHQGSATYPCSFVSGPAG